MANVVLFTWKEIISKVCFINLYFWRGKLTLIYSNMLNIAIVHMDKFGLGPELNNYGMKILQHLEFVGAQTLKFRSINLMAYLHVTGQFPSRMTMSSSLSCQVWLECGIKKKVSPEVLACPCTIGESWKLSSVYPKLLICSIKKENGMSQVTE